MAIPYDPYFSQSDLSAWNQAFRSIPLGKAGQRDLAAYIASPGLTAANVARWQAAAGSQAAQQLNPWANDYTRAELVAILAKFPRQDLVDAAAFQELYFNKNTSRPAIAKAITKGRNKAEVGAILDQIRPRMVQAQALPDEWLNLYLSSWAKGTPERRRADAVLSFLGEVRQQPEAGGNPAMLEERFFTLANAIDWIWLWQYGAWKNVYFKESWYQIQLFKQSKGYLAQVHFWTDTSEGELLFADSGKGWPERDTWGDLAESQKEYARRKKERKDEKNRQRRQRNQNKKRRGK